MHRYLKIIWQFAKTSLISQTSYRPSFIFSVVSKVLRVLITVYFFWAIYAQVPEIAGWNLYELLLLFGFFSIVDFVTEFLFYRTLLYDFPWLIYYGDLDLWLIKPINPLFYSSFNMYDLMDLTSGIGAIMVFIYALLHLPIDWTLGIIILGIILFVCAILFIYAISVLCSSIFFFTISGRGLGDVLDNIISLGRYPISIYRGYLQAFFIYVLPIVVLATLPAQTFLGNVNWGLIFYVIIFTSVLLIVAIKVWFWALKHYSSASS